MDEVNKTLSIYVLLFGPFGFLIFIGAAYCLLTVRLLCDDLNEYIIHIFQV